MVPALVLVISGEKLSHGYIGQKDFEIDMSNHTEYYFNRIKKWIGAFQMKAITQQTINIANETSTTTKEQLGDIVITFVQRLEYLSLRPNNEDVEGIALAIEPLMSTYLRQSFLDTLFDSSGPAITFYGSKTEYEALNADQTKERDIVKIEWYEETFFGLPTLIYGAVVGAIVIVLGALYVRGQTRHVGPQHKKTKKRGQIKTYETLEQDDFEATTSATIQSQREEIKELRADIDRLISRDRKSSKQSAIQSIDGVQLERRLSENNLRRLEKGEYMRDMAQLEWQQLKQSSIPVWKNTPTSNARPSVSHTNYCGKLAQSNVGNVKTLTQLNKMESSKGSSQVGSDVERRGSEQSDWKECESMRSSFENWEVTQLDRRGSVTNGTESEDRRVKKQSMVRSTAERGSSENSDWNECESMRSSFDDWAVTQSDRRKSVTNASRVDNVTNEPRMSSAMNEPRRDSATDEAQTDSVTSKSRNSITNAPQLKHGESEKSILQGID